MKNKKTDWETKAKQRVKRLETSLSFMLDATDQLLKIIDSKHPASDYVRRAQITAREIMHELDE